MPGSVRSLLEPRFGRSLGNVRVHDDTQAHTATSALHARAFALGGDIYFARGAFDPTSRGGAHLIAHEVAHTLQPGAGTRIARKSLTDIAPATRSGLSVSRVAPEQSAIDGWLAGYFDPAAGVHAHPAATVEFGGSIPAALQPGFTGAAHDLADTASLPTGAILDLAVDLRSRGGPNAIFRFTRYMDGKDEKILIEQTVLLAPAPSATAAPQATPPSTGGTASPRVTGSVAVGAIKVEIGAGFAADQAQQIVAALKLLPPPILAKADGVTFDYKGSGKGPGDEAGEYQAETDTIHIWGVLFAASPRRIGAGTIAQADVLHEIGHLLDLRPEFAAQIARDKAAATKKRLESELNHPKINLDNPDPLAGISDDSSPARKAEEQRLKTAIAAAQKQIDTQEKAMATARSMTGEEGNASSDTETLLGEFGKALAGDGVKPVVKANKANRRIDADNAAARKANEAHPDAPQQPYKDHVRTLSGNVTDYANTDLREAFAEAFSLYVLDAALLQAIRPKTHAFFAKQFPKSAPAGGGKP